MQKCRYINQLEFKMNLYPFVHIYFVCIMKLYVHVTCMLKIAHISLRHNVKQKKNLSFLIGFRIR